MKQRSNQYVYYLLGRDNRFDSFAECRDFYQKLYEDKPCSFIDMHTHFGWFIVRQNLNTGKRILYDFTPKQTKLTNYEKQILRKNVSNSSRRQICL